MADPDREKLDIEGDHDLELGWHCTCGAWNDHDFHCDDCKADPPWGCDCSFCEPDGFDEEDEWDDGIGDEWGGVH